MPSARDAIEALIFSYAERLDAGDFAGVGELFEHARYGSVGAATLTGAEVARLGGGEFTILLDRIRKPSDAAIADVQPKVRYLAIARST